MVEDGERCCRICYDGPGESREGADMGLVSPCGCAGSSAHIHVECLKRVHESPNFKALHCPTCKQKYDVATCLMLATHGLKRLRLTRCYIDGDLELADAYTELAKVFFDMGSYQNASNLYDLALACKQVAYGGDHPSVAQSLNSKGVLLIRQGKLDEAEECFDQATRVFERAFGQDSLQVGKVLGNRSLLHRTKKDYTTALQLMDKCLCILESGKNREQELQLFTARMNRSLLLLQLQRVGEAEKLARECVTYGLRVFSKNSPELAKWEGNLGMILMRKGDLDTGRLLIDKSLAKLQKLGFDNSSRAWWLKIRKQLAEMGKPVKRCRRHAKSQNKENLQLSHENSRR